MIRELIELIELEDLNELELLVNGDILTVRYSDDEIDEIVFIGTYRKINQEEYIACKEGDTTILKLKLDETSRQSMSTKNGELIYNGPRDSLEVLSAISNPEGQEINTYLESLQ